MLKKVSLIEILFKESLWDLLWRIRITKTYLIIHNYYRPSISNFLKQVIFKIPRSIRIQRHLSKIINHQEYYKVMFKKIRYPLFWSKSYSLRHLFLVIDESLDSKSWHFYEIPETTVSSGDVVVDCGASEGLFSLRVADRAARIYIIEPSPMFLNCLYKTFQNIKNVEIIPKAVGDKEDKGFLSGASICSKISDEGIDIQLTTIDSLFHDNSIKIDYIKADLEGYEMKMLLGAKNTIKAYKPKIAITVYHRGQNVNVITDYLAKLVPTYKFKIKGFTDSADEEGNPTMLHCYI